jgi:hypothetical protein
MGGGKGEGDYLNRDSRFKALPGNCSLRSSFGFLQQDACCTPKQVILEDTPDFLSEGQKEGYATNSGALTCFRSSCIGFLREK